jgi:hypothetical protein
VRKTKGTLGVKKIGDRQMTTYLSVLEGVQSEGDNAYNDWHHSLKDGPEKWSGERSAGRSTTTVKGK